MHCKPHVNLKLSSSHSKNIKKKQVKCILRIHFIFNPTISKILSFQHVIIINLQQDVLQFLFHSRSSKSGVCFAITAQLHSSHDSVATCG